MMWGSMGRQCRTKGTDAGYKQKKRIFKGIKEKEGAANWWIEVYCEWLINGQSCCIHQAVKRDLFILLAPCRRVIVAATEALFLGNFNDRFWWRKKLKDGLAPNDTQPSGGSASFPSFQPCFSPSLVIFFFLPCCLHRHFYSSMYLSISLFSLFDWINLLFLKSTFISCVTPTTHTRPTKVYHSCCILITLFTLFVVSFPSFVATLTEHRVTPVGGRGTCR